MSLSQPYLVINNDDEYEKAKKSLEKKIANGQVLTYREIGFFCQHQKFEYLRIHEFCDDEFYSRAHLELNTPDDLKYDPNYKKLLERYGKEVASLTEDDKIHYQLLLDEWEKIITKGNHTNQLLQFYCTETREEIRTLRREFNVRRIPESSPEFTSRKRKIIEFSKYRYIITRGIFEIIIGHRFYKLSLNGKEIFYNEYSLSHIITRHYGLPMKSYQTNKSHFAQQIHYEKIHLELESIFRMIDESGLYSKDSINEINYKFEDVIYRVYCEQAVESGTKIVRIATFFPLEDSDEIRTLNISYSENIVERNFSIYTKR